MDLVLHYDTVALRREVRGRDTSGTANTAKVAGLVGRGWRRSPHLDTEGGEEARIAGVIHVRHLPHRAPIVKNIIKEETA